MRIIDDFVLNAMTDKTSYGINDYDPGSRSYSWDIHHVHFVQLQLNPWYESPDIGVYNSMAWLKENLRRHRNSSENSNNPVVLNFHEFDDDRMNDSDFRQALDLANVTAIFTGHIHSDIGFKRFITSWSGRPVPMFRCGSAAYNFFLLVQFYADGSPPMRVFNVYSVTGDPNVFGVYPLL